MLDLLGSEYGLTPYETRKLTRREISSLIDGMVSRKSGYNSGNDRVNIEPTEEILKKIERQNKKLFGGVNGESRK